MTKPVLKIQGPPGSGKTTLLVREALRLIFEDGYAPDTVRILAISPQNQNRLRNLLNREGKRLGHPSPPVAVHTMDRFLLQILSLTPEAIPLPDGHPPLHRLELLSDEDACLILHALLQAQAATINPPFYPARHRSFAQEVYAAFRHHTLHYDTFQQTLQSTLSLPEQIVWLQEVYQKFLQRTVCKGYLIHSQLAPLCAAVLTQPGLTQQLTGSIQALLVDEAQELSSAHYQILSQLQPHLQLVFSGHEHLSIRSFRGAAPYRFGQLAERFPITNQNLSSCLRGNEPVLSLLNQWLPKALWEGESVESSQLEDMIRFLKALDPEQEAQLIAQQIQEHLLRQTPVYDPILDTTRPSRWQDHAILLRNGQFKPLLKAVLTQAGIPVQADGFPGELLEISHYLYDSLFILSVWDKLRHNTLEESTLDEVNHSVSRWLQYWDTLPPGSMPGLTDLLQQPSSVSRSIQPQLTALTDAADRFSENLDVYQLIWHLLATGHCLERLPGKTNPDNPYQGALGGFLRKVATLQETYQNAMESPLPLDEVLAVYETLWSVETPETKDAVRILSIHQAQGESFPFVYIPFMRADTFPAPTSTPWMFESPGVTPDPVMLQAATVEEEKRLLAAGILTATHQVVLSYHQSHEGKPVVASSFYQELYQKKQKLLYGTVLPSEEADSADSRTGLSIQQQDAHAQYEGASPWAKLAKSVDQPLFSESEVLQLSPTSIQTYIKCPRQFFYRKILRLEEATSDAASRGLVIHRLMEVLNKQFGQVPYTLETLQTLAERFFAFETHHDWLLEQGFHEDDFKHLIQLSPIERNGLRELILASMADLAQKGYFQKPIQRIEAEKSLGSFQLEGIARCQFTGKVDALIQTGEGYWEIVDYKFYKPNKYEAKPDTCQKRLANVLTPINGEATTHSERFNVSDNKPRDYQLPLYYLALQQEEPYRNQIQSTALQIIRPAFPNKPEQGAIRLELPVAEIQQHTRQLLDDLNTHIVQPILSSHRLEPNPGESCKYCSFLKICEAAEETDGGEDEE